MQTQCYFVYLSHQRQYFLDWERTGACHDHFRPVAARLTAFPAGAEERAEAARLSGATSASSCSRWSCHWHYPLIPPPVSFIYRDVASMKGGSRHDSAEAWEVVLKGTT